VTDKSDHLLLSDRTFLIPLHDERAADKWVGPVEPWQVKTRQRAIAQRSARDRKSPSGKVGGAGKILFNRSQSHIGHDDR
jgi:hypothetical protein